MLSEQAKNNEILKLENKEMKAKLIKQEQWIENIRRANNVIFYGLPEHEHEQTDTLVDSVLDLCIKVMKVEVSKTHLNYVKRLGQPSNQDRPVVVSLVSNICKNQILKNSLKFKGSKIFVSEDLDPTMQARRKKLIMKRNQMKNEGQDCKLCRSGLLVNGKFLHHTELIEEDEQEQSPAGDHVPEEEYAEDADNNKKRKVMRKEPNPAKTNSSVMELFRARTDSTTTSKTKSKGEWYRGRKE